MNLVKNGNEGYRNYSSENMILIKLEHLEKSFREGDTVRHVLRDINLKITKGEIITFLGRSGSGKSTLLNLLAGMDIPDGGSIQIQDVSMNSMGERERTVFRRKNMGFVFQFFNLIPTLTVEENLLLPLELNGLLGNTSLQEVEDLLDKVGLADRLNSYPDKLSGGEQQRVAIARALIHDPMLVIADEPTGNLDVHTSDNVISLLYDLTKARMKTLVVATHSPELATMGDHVYSLREGQLHHENKETLL
jgi:putative ABC transport system ATP-binding protein